ncbi:MAG: hypothetical protein R2699_03375 [Acidimicrobiales bacterium]
MGFADELCTAAATSASPCRAEAEDAGGGVGVALLAGGVDDHHRLGDGVERPRQLVVGVALGGDGALDPTSLGEERGRPSARRRRGASTNATASTTATAVTPPNSSLSIVAPGSASPRRRRRR